MQNPNMRVINPTEHSDSGEISHMASEIDIYSIGSIQSFGGEVASQTQHFTDKILEQARSVDLDETGSQLNAVITTAQEFNLDQFGNALTKISIFNGVLKRFNKRKEKALAQFESVKTRVEKMVAQVEITATQLASRNNDYQLMYESVQDEHHMLGLHVKAIELRLEELESQLDQSPPDYSDLRAVERHAVLQANKQALAKRADDLMALQHSAFQMLPMVRIIQSNNLALVDKFNTIQQLTLPAWKRAFMLALALDEQRSAVQLTDTIDNATNALLRQNAELLHQNSVSTAQANQRLVIDVDTLKQVHKKILETLSDVQEVHETGAIERKQAIGELAQMRLEFSNSLATLNQS